MHTIIDLNGEPKQVTSITKALAQAKLFKGFRSADHAQDEFILKMAAYWEDMYQKLLQLRRETRNKK